MMQGNVFEESKKQQAFWPLLALVVWALGMLFSRAMVSTGMFLFFLSALRLAYFRSGEVRNYFSSLLFFGPVLFFILPLIHLPFTEDISYGLTHLRLKLPFLLLPFSFYMHRHLIQRFIPALLLSFSGIVFLTALFSVFLFFIHQETHLNDILHGKHIPVPFNPVRFSLMLAMSGFSFLYYSGVYKDRTRMLLLSLFICTVILQHVLATRSGIIVLYALVFSYGLFLWRKSVHTSRLALFFLVPVLLPVLAWFTVPSFQARIRYMRYEMELIQNNQVTFGSDVMRRLSIMGGWHVFTTHPLLGAGGDMKQQMQDWYVDTYQLTDEAVQQLPHNQFVWMLACYGLIGGIFFTLLFFFPFFRLKGWQHPLLAAFTLMFFVSFLVEPTWEEQIGSAYYNWLWGLVIIYSNKIADE